MKSPCQKLQSIAVLMAVVLIISLLVITKAGASRSANDRHIIQPPRAEKPPRIDGTLNDTAWQKAIVSRDFKTLHPAQGKAPSEATEIYLTYDRENIYVGIHSFDSEPAKVRAQGTGRDNPGDDDWVAFCVDSRSEGLGAEFFMLTAGGAQVDGTLDANGSANLDFNTQWSGEAKRTNDGWIATMAIPFKALPFRWGEQVVMSFKVARLISRKSEEVDYPEIVQGHGPQLTQFQTVEFAGIEKGLPEDTPLIDIQGLYQRKLRLKGRSAIATYEGRLKAWGDASVFDYLAFPSRELKPSAKPISFRKEQSEEKVTSLFNRLEYFPGKQVRDLDTFLRKTETTSFIVIKDDRVLYEKYFNGYDRDSIVTSFSVAKSFDSVLVGIAIDEGRIGSLSDPITKYLPELLKRDKRFASITIKDLLMMSSGLRYEEGEPHHDDWLTYLYPDLHELALQKTEIAGTPAKQWLYNNYNPLLIGMILERVTGKSVTEYLQEKLWSPLGMEYAGSWSINAEKSGLEKMESGINARAIDFAKFGSLVLHGGNWRGRQVVSSRWIEQATQPEDKPSDYYDNDPFFVSQGHYYKYFWWGSRRPGGKSDFYGVGNKGQYIYVSPQKNLIIVRNGIDYGLPSVQWLKLFYDFASAEQGLRPPRKSMADRLPAGGR